MNKSFARNSDELLNLFCENNTKLELDVVQDENSILNLDFAWKSMLVIGDFLQLPSSSFEHVTLTDSWCLLKFHELTEIVHQNSHPEFAELLNRVRVGKQTQSDIAAIHAIANTDIFEWPENLFRLYMTNHLVDNWNMEVMNNATNTIFTTHAVDGKANCHTGAFQCNSSDDINITKTGNLEKNLNFCVGARVQLTGDVDVEDKLCIALELVQKVLWNIFTIVLQPALLKMEEPIYVQFENEKSGNKAESNSLSEELQICVPIPVKTRKFSYSLHGKKRSPF